MDWEQMLQMLLPIIGQTAVHELSDKVADLSKGTDTEWQKTVLDLMAQAIKKYGPNGMALAVQEVNNLLDHKPASIPDWADLKTASDIVAQMENAEADHKKVVNDYITKVSEVLGVILSALIKGLISGVK